MKKPEKQEVKKAQKQESIQDGVKDLETYTHYYIPQATVTTRKQKFYSKIIVRK